MTAAIIDTSVHVKTRGVQTLYSPGRWPKSRSVVAERCAVSATSPVAAGGEREERCRLVRARQLGMCPSSLRII